MSERTGTSIAGKVALVTGGARGLGAATARSLSAAGARVYVLDRHHPDPAEQFDEQVTFLVGDVTDLDSMTQAVETVRRQAGRLDIVTPTPAWSPAAPRSGSRRRRRSTDSST